MALPNLNASQCIGKPATIYALIDPRDKSAFYVGVTTNRLCNRLSCHRNDATFRMVQSDRCAIMRDIETSGFRTIIGALETVNFTDWVEAEQFWISYLKAIGAQLTNKAIGGPGATGSKHTEATRRRQQRAASGRDMSRLHTADVRARASAPLRKKISVNGQEFVGIKKAAKALGIPYSTLQSWVTSGRAVRI